MTDRKFDSLAVHAGREDLVAQGLHVPPIDLSSTYPLPDITSGGGAYDALAGGGRPPAEGGLVYARLWNPTIARFEDALAALEGTDESVAFASGMAAVNAAITVAASTGRGKHVVAVRPLYGGTDFILTNSLLGTEVTYCDAHEIAETIRPDTCLVMLETPANPTLELIDLSAAVKAAGDVPVMVDNTFATPVLQNPAAHGVAMVLHSATKFLGGHGDVVAGVVACNSEWATRLRGLRAITGSILHPMAGYLLHRGLQTLPIRVRAQQANAAALAEWLQTVPSVRKVYYPGLADCDPEGLVGAGKQMRGPGSMLSMDLAGGFEQTASVTKAVRLFTHAVSLGGVDSLIESPSGITHRIVEEGARPHASVLRMSIGLEDVDDLRADLAQALGA